MTSRDNDLDLPPGSSSTLLEWRVLIGPLDDWPDKRPTPQDQFAIIEACVSAFRNRLLREQSKGVIPVGYGPVEET